MRIESFTGQARAALSRSSDSGRAPDIATGRGFLAQLRIASARTGTPYRSDDHRERRSAGTGRFGWVFPILLIADGVLGDAFHWIGLLAALVLVLVLVSTAYVSQNLVRRDRAVLPLPEPAAVEDTTISSTASTPTRRTTTEERHSVPRHGGRAGRFVVCRDGALAYRVVTELATRFGGEVTVLLRSGNANVVTAPHLPDQHLVVYTMETDSPTARVLPILASWATASAAPGPQQ